MFKNLKKDLPASLVVFFVALPLCLGIALASGAPLFAGLIAGAIGGIVVGTISGSQLGVSGPAAGLVVIVLTAITSLGSYEAFLLAVFIAGLIQILLGLVKAGVIGYYFPSSVIKGMLSAIGIIIFIQQFPHALGYDKTYAGDTRLLFSNQESIGSSLVNMFEAISLGAVVVTLISLFILIVWDKYLVKQFQLFKTIPAALIAVAVGIIYQVIFGNSESPLSIHSEKLVQVPVPESFSSFMSQFTFPDFSNWANGDIYIVAITLAVVASLETLLCVEATDKMDPRKRVTPTNRELIAQGAGNTISGLIGGLPITQVIVRSSANIQSGGQTKLSAILHGVLLILSVIIIPNLLNLIPLAVLAAILLIIGYKLANPKQFIQIYKLGKSQFIPFIVTVIAIVATDLLSGIILGLTVGFITILINSFKNSHFLHIKDKSNGVHKIKMTLAEEVTFLNKGSILRELDNLPKDTYLELDVRKTRVLDYDVLEILDEFSVKAKNRNIMIKLISERGIVENPESFKEFFKLKKQHKNFKTKPINNIVTL